MNSILVALDKYKETLKILVGAVFLLSGVWNFVVPVDEEQVISLIDLIFAIIGPLIGGPAAIRAIFGKELVSK